MNSFLGIQSASHYWQDVVHPNILEYEKYKSPRVAFNLATSLWHLQEWVVVELNQNSDDKQLKAAKTKFKATLIAECPVLGILHDLTTANKHAIVSTPLGGVVSTSALTKTVHLSFLGSQPVTEHGSEFSIKLADGTFKNLDQIFIEVINYWDANLNRWLNTKN
ncbi:MAG: hypothetical protein EB038_09115 [Cyclobacteriaceae bacterium]|jgi:hypothetical protein|nr:hypothetical protein [Cyclobacteriaceae bacterium]